MRRRRVSWQATSPTARSSSSTRSRPARRWRASVYERLTGAPHLAPSSVELHFSLPDYSAGSGLRENAASGFRSATADSPAERISDHRVQPGRDRIHAIEEARFEASRCLDCGINTIFDGEKLHSLRRLRGRVSRSCACASSRPLDRLDRIRGVGSTVARTTPRGASIRRRCVGHHQGRDESAFAAACARSAAPSEPSPWSVFSFKEIPACLSA